MNQDLTITVGYMNNVEAIRITGCSGRNATKFDNFVAKKKPWKSPISCELGAPDLGLSKANVLWPRERLGGGGTASRGLSEPIDRKY